MYMYVYFPEVIRTSAKNVISYLKELRHGSRMLKSLASIFQIRRL